jgi:hypothetical protein
LSAIVALTLLGVWAVGVLVVLGHCLNRARVVRAALATAEACPSSWGSDLPLAVKQSDAVLEPGLVAIIRPVLLVPIAVGVLRGTPALAQNDRDGPPPGPDNPPALGAPLTTTLDDTEDED